ncbi:MAG: lysophospholipid acyltransferase family protein [Verrucomicrobiota bacterium]
MQDICRQIVALLGIEVATRGPAPARGLLVSNHLSYLDIIVYSSLTPTVFVSKADVRYWPIFGQFAHMSGTLFVKREKRGDVSRLADEMQEVLESDLVLALFPEGTSSGGETVLPFKSSLLEPIVQRNHPVAAAAIDYHLENGSVADEIAYWRDMTLVPHLMNVFTKERIRATVAFAPPQPRSGDRKQVARDLHAEVLGLKGQITAK